MSSAKCSATSSRARLTYCFDTHSKDNLRCVGCQEMHHTEAFTTAGPHRKTNDVTNYAVHQYHCLCRTTSTSKSRHGHSPPLRSPRLPARASACFERAS